MRKWLIRGLAVFVGRKAWEMYQRRNGAGRGTAPGSGGTYGSGSVNPPTR